MDSNQQDGFREVHGLGIRVILPVLASAAAAVVTVYLLNAANPLAASFAALGGIMFAAAVVSPKVGLISLLLLCGYSDFVKRILTFFGDLNFEQLGYVLAGAPLVVAGLYTALVTRWAYHRIPLHRRDGVLALAVFVFVAANIFVGAKQGLGTLGALKQAINTAGYAAMMPVGVALMRDREMMLWFFRLATFVFLPVALYGIYQAIFGLADFEYDYLRSGYTIGAFELSDVRPRPFSTLNTAGSLGDMSAILFVMCLHPFITRRADGLTPGEKGGRVFIALIYALACILTLVRHSPFILFVVPFALFFFRTKRRTKIFYSVAVASFVVLVLSSSFLLRKLPEWDPSVHARSAFTEQLLRIQTYGDRLVGFSNLIEGTDMYSWFGLKENEKGGRTTFSHDPVSGALVDYGIVGLFVLSAAVALALKLAHGRLLKMVPGNDRETALVFLAMMVGLLTSHLLFHGVVTVFPANAFFWLLAGCFLKLTSGADEKPRHALVPHQVKLRAAGRERLRRERQGLPRFSR